MLPPHPIPYPLVFLHNHPHSLSTKSTWHIVLGVKNVKSEGYCDDVAYGTMVGEEGTDFNLLRYRAEAGFGQFWRLWKNYKIEKDLWLEVCFFWILPELADRIESTQNPPQILFCWPQISSSLFIHTFFLRTLLKSLRKTVPVNCGWSSLACKSTSTK